MRQACVVLLLIAFTGCALLRRPEKPAPEAPAAPTLVTPKAPPPPPRHLACIQHPRIDLWERRLRRREQREAIRQSLVRARFYLPRVKRIMAREGLPPSLALLPVLESEYHRRASGTDDDLGLWQLRGTTARRLGLVINHRRDERLHPYRSTRAAARYLRHLRRRYPDWALALAAYNAGERRVDRAIARRPGGTFWDLAERGYLPTTSRDYVPRFLAVVRIVEGKEICRRPLPLEKAEKPSSPVS
jgi:hypothetical protein